ncbi:MAG: hypothetical protein A2W23_03280 [Planctomycetes bacterium RBG_16_43_13]|nr:MAG: hypothetical protein A2W23_03280 [Planctomycetes bacterium RBG_16_43_13]
MLKKFHSLSGIVPIGAFLLEHLWTNAHVLGGAKSYDAAVQNIQDLPLLIFLEVFFIWLPILYHGCYGLYVVFLGSSNLLRYPYQKNWLYWAQRVTGIIAFAFIIYHFWTMRVDKVTTFAGVTKELAEAGNIAIYFVGLASVIFHFANGLWNFLIKWGVTTGPQAQRVSGYVFTLFGILLFVVSIVSLFAFK